VRVAAIAIERGDPLQVGFEGTPVEVALPPPRQPRPFLRLERVLQIAFTDLLDALEVEARDPNLTVLAAAGTDECEKQGGEHRRARHGHAAEEYHRVCQAPGRLRHRSEAP